MSLSTLYRAVKHQVDRVLNDPGYGPKRAFDRFISTLIIASVALLVEEFWLLPRGTLPAWLYTIDAAILWIFAVEYALRLWVVKPELPTVVVVRRRDRLLYHLSARLMWAFKPMHLVDLVAILPLFPFLRSLRVLRVLRLFTHVRYTRTLFRYFDPFAAANQTVKTYRLLYLFVAAFIVLAIGLGASMGLVAEHRDNPKLNTPFDALYWATVTITTVGYGDVTPVTSGGRVVAMVLMLTGFVLFALLAGVVSQTLGLSLLRIREEGIRMTAMVNHIVVCGWNRHSPMLLQELRLLGAGVARRVVVFATAERPEGLPEWVTYVQGDPTQEVELSKVRLAVADILLVVGEENHGGTFSDADARTLLTVFTLRSYERKLPASGVTRTRALHIIAEALDPDNVAFLRQAGADEVLETARIGSTLLAQAAATPAASGLATGLLDAEGGLLRLDPPAGLVLPRPFWEVATSLKREREALVVGLERAGQLRYNPPADEPVLPGDRLVALGVSRDRTRVLEAEAGHSFWGPLTPPGASPLD